MPSPGINDQRGNLQTDNTNMKPETNDCFMPEPYESLDLCYTLAIEESKYMVS